MRDLMNASTYQSSDRMSVHSHLVVKAISRVVVDHFQRAANKRLLGRVSQFTALLLDDANHFPSGSRGGVDFHVGVPFADWVGTICVVLAYFHEGR